MFKISRSYFAWKTVVVACAARGTCSAAGVDAQIPLLSETATGHVLIAHDSLVSFKVVSRIVYHHHQIPIAFRNAFHFFVLYELVTRDCDFRSESYLEKVATFGNWSLFIIYL
jgi:hypothetical protein